MAESIVEEAERIVEEAQKIDNDFRAFIADLLYRENQPKEGRDGQTH